MGSRHNSRKKQQIKETKVQADQKFAVDERVLCYEPDQKKARVLYDSKVLEVVERKVHGRTKVEYKIHFFGWNSSWDRYVDEECVLKDTDENRALQKELKERAAELLQTHLKKRKRKKTLSELLKEATSGKNPGASSNSKSKPRSDDESSRSHSSSDSSDQDTSDEEDTESARIVLTDYSRSLLERDCFNITRRDKLVRVPAEYSVVCILEAYVKHLGFTELQNLLEQRENFLKSNNSLPLSSIHSISVSNTSAKSKYSISKAQQPKSNLEYWLEEINRIYRKVRQAQEVIYGLNTIFDHMLYLTLLYSAENDQYEDTKKMYPVIPSVNCSYISPKLPPQGQQTATDGSRSDIKEPSNEAADKNHSVTDSTISEKPCSSLEIVPYVPTRLQSKAACSQDPKKITSEAAMWYNKVEKFTKDLDSWRMLPLSYFHQEEPCPSMIYGVVHFVRLIVKLPDILNRMGISRRKARIIADHVNKIQKHLECCYPFPSDYFYFSPSTMSNYEEDQINIDTTKPDGVRDTEVTREEVDSDVGQFNTRLCRPSATAKTNSQFAKVIEVPLTSVDGGLDEQKLTVALDHSKSEDENLKAIENQPMTPLSVDVSFTDSVSKLENQPTSSPVKKPLDQQLKRKAESTKKAAFRRIALSTTVTKHRHIRESAANAAIKNAHIFASQHNFSSRSSMKLAVKDKPMIGRLSNESSSSSSPVKRLTRTCNKSPTSANSSERVNISIRETVEQMGFIHKRGVNESPRSSPERSRIKLDPDDLKVQSNSRTTSPDRVLGSPRKITSPRTSKAHSPHRDREFGSSSSPTKTPHKYTSSYSTTIRLRSKSGERQLRSKGSLINALSLPMQTSPRPSKLFREGSPKRRESTSASSKDSCSSQQSISPSSTSTKQSESIRSLRSRK